MIQGLLNKRRWEIYFRDFDTVIAGLGMTLKVVLCGWILAMIIGIILGVMSASGKKLPKIINKIYVEFFQNTPLPLQFFFYYSGIPMALKILLNSVKPIKMSKFFIGSIALGLYHGAYIAEVIRAGIEAVPRGQKEAGLSQGFTNGQTMRYIIIPQTMKMILPSLANQTLALFKNSSCLAMIAGLDLMYYSDVTVTYTGFVQGYFVAALIYFIFCFPIALLAKNLEKKAKLTPGIRVSIFKKRNEVA